MSDLNVLEIEVSEQDIRKGRPSNYYCCPVARAIRRKLHDPLAKVVVIYSAIIITVANTSFKYATTGAMREFMQDFDRRKSVAPTTFKIPLIGVY